MSYFDLGSVLAGFLINAMISWLNYRKSIENGLHTAKVAADIAELAVNTNSIKDALVKVTGESEHAKGVIQGAAEERKKTP